jgi:CheY-like chemotaxis protein
MKLMNILLIEDNEGDVLLTTEALEETTLINRLSVIRDGEAAIKFFSSIVDPADLPDLVLLDINLPKKSGYQVLEYIKGHENYMHIPVVMLTTSSSEKDIARCYKSLVNCYLIKPLDVTDFINSIKKMGEFWGGIASIPNSVKIVPQIDNLFKQ